jgi:hypothetical protein
MNQKDRNETKKQNLDDLILRGAVYIPVSEKTCVLLDVKLKGNLLEDFLRMYPNAGKRNTDIAKRIFRNKPAELDYSFIFDEDRKLVHLFNHEFARYDIGSKKVIVNSAEEVLLNYISKQDGELIPAIRPPLRPIIIPENPENPIVTMYGIPSPSFPPDPWNPEPVILYGMPNPRDNIVLYGMPRPGQRDRMVKYGMPKPQDNINYKYGFSTPNDNTNNPTSFTIDLDPKENKNDEEDKKDKKK